MESESPAKVEPIKRRKKSKKSKIIAASILIGSFVSILVLMALSTRPYLTVEQVVSNPEAYDNQEIQVIGDVKKFIDDEFELTEGSDKISIIPDGIDIPKEVENGTEIVVEGIFDASKLSIKASQILTQCS